MHLLYTINFWMRFATAITLGLIFWLVFVQMSPVYFSLVLALVLCCIMLFEWLPMVRRVGVPLLVLTPFYPILPFCLLIILNNTPLLRPLLYFLFCLVFAFDTGSYLVGNLYGNHLICPTISSRKTWEGFIGGFVCALIAVLILLYQYTVVQSWFSIVSMTLTICFIALFGDLFESWLKRKAGLKDSGTLLPGHGGFLDRFDGIMFVVFFAYVYRYQFIILLGI